MTGLILSALFTAGIWLGSLPAPHAIQRRRRMVVEVAIAALVVWGLLQ